MLNLAKYKAGLLFKASLFFIGLNLFVACSKVEQVPVSIQGNTMGTTYSITIVEAGKTLESEALKASIDELLLEVNRQMSTYIDDSEISTFNRGSIDEWISVSSDFVQVVSLSQQLSELSDGKFDVTIGPLIELWGFGRQSSEEAPPSEAIDAAKAKVGWNFLSVDESTNQLKRSKDISLNLSAIAKGFGVDKIAEYLDAKGIENYLVEIGGEIRVKGLNAQSKPWRLGIEKPSLSQQGAQQIVALSNASIATSGDYRNYFEQDGIRYSHTIDPQLGKPVKHNIASVTVIAPTAALADGFATTLNVMGLNDALRLAEQENINAFFILYDQSSATGYREEMTSNFERFFAQ